MKKLNMSDEDNLASSPTKDDDFSEYVVSNDHIFCCLERPHILLYYMTILADGLFIGMILSFDSRSSWPIYWWKRNMLTMPCRSFKKTKKSCSVQMYFYTFMKAHGSL